MSYLALAGAGMGFSMVTLLIAVQTSVPRDQLGIATSGTVFFRSIGGAVGVAVMGAVLSAQMHVQANHLPAVEGSLSAEKLADLLRHPDALLHPGARAQVPASVLDALRQILAAALHGVFVVGLIVAVLALIVTLFLPKGTAQEHAHGGRTRA
jgi:Na+/melibiose symporter-like transporter